MHCISLCVVMVDNNLSRYYNLGIISWGWCYVQEIASKHMNCGLLASPCTSSSGWSAIASESSTYLRWQEWERREWQWTRTVWRISSWACIFYISSPAQLLDLPRYHCIRRVPRARIVRMNNYTEDKLLLLLLFCTLNFILCASRVPSFCHTRLPVD